VEKADRNMKNLDKIKVVCDFCGEKKKFLESKQVPLRIDKTSRFQHVFAFICGECTTVKKRKTLDQQQIRSFTGRSKDKNEQSLFDAEDRDGF